MPNAFFCLGWGVGLCTFFFISFPTFLTMYFLALSASESKKEEPTYFSVCTQAYSILGPIADFFIVLIGTSACLAYVMLIKKNFCSLFELEEYKYYVVAAV